jgi:lactate dehydrogenase-like 2-hydroxyacid dehydrogenase
MKITIFNPKDDFSSKLQNQLSTLGTVTYTKDRSPLPLPKLLEMASGADIICCDPDPLGGFEKAKDVLTKVMDSVPDLKGICLSTTSFGWVDLDYCKKRKLSVSNVPGYSKESVAESAIAFLLGAMKRIFVSDRRTSNGKYSLQKGFELKGKTLGIIGLGSIGSTMAKHALGLGMNVIAYNRSPKTMESVKMVSFDQLLKEADAISLHTTHETKNDKMIGEKELSKMKQGVFVVNTVDRELVDEVAMAKALASGQVDTYVYEAEDLINTPLAKQENAIGFKGFAWYTKEALENLYAIIVENTSALAKGKPINRVI